MFVRQKIGPQAGEIIEMPYLAAQNCLSVGSADPVTDEEVAAAGLKPADITAPAKAETIPPGYRVDLCVDLDDDENEFTPGGYDVFDAGGVRLTADIDIPNLVAARSFAWDHYDADQEAARQPEPAPIKAEDGTGEPGEPEWDDKWRDLHWMTQVKLAKQFDDAVTKKDEAVQVLEAVETKRKEEAERKKAEENA